MKAIVYTSQTGFTQRYAQLLSQQVGVPAYSVKEAAGALPRESEIFYMGPIVAGGLKGLEKIMHRYTIRGAALVGMNPVGNGELWTEAAGTAMEGPGSSICGAVTRRSGLRALPDS